MRNEKGKKMNYKKYMSRGAGVLSLLLFLCSFIFCFGCKNIYDEPKTDKVGMGAIVVSVNGQGSGRTVMPDAVMDDFTEFRLEFVAKTAGNANFIKIWANGSGTVDLAAGSWELTVIAYFEGEQPGDLIEAAKSGKKVLTIPVGETVPVNVQLLPIEEGAGVFSWDIGFNGNFESASMELWRITHEQGAYAYTLLDDKTVNFIASGVTQDENLSSEMQLDAGQYRVDFALSNGEETVRISEALHVYKNMESSYAITFNIGHFPVTLANYIISAWDSASQAWDFSGNGITVAHFEYLGINGIDDETHFDTLTERFNALCIEHGTPDDLTAFKAMVDMAFITIASEGEGFCDPVNYAYRGEAEAAIGALAVNGSALDLEWDADGEILTVQAGGYELELTFVIPVITIDAHPAATTSLYVGNISGSLSVGASVTGNAALSYRWYRAVSADASDDSPVTGTMPSADFAIPANMVSGAYNYFCEVTATGWAAPVRSCTAAVFVYDKSPKNIEMMYVPAGTFLMGSPEDEPDRGSDETQHEVTLTSGFYMGKHPVTQEQYLAIMNYNPSSFSNSPAIGENQNKRPVEMVTWYDVIEFCNKLSEEEGLSKVYTITGRTPTSRYPITSATVTPDWSANGYRLPTEAEWEYACRAGTTTAYNTGETADDNTGWYLDNSDGMTHEVGKKPPNAWGLYDMHGNVLERCWDWHGDYTSGAQTDPVSTHLGADRVHRGGSWLHSADYMRSANRQNAVNANFRSERMGFRLVRPAFTIKTQPDETTNVFVGNISGNLKVAANGSTALSYQWYSNTTNSNSGGSPTGVASAAFTIPTTLTEGTYYYYCEVISASWGTSIRSNVAMVNVIGPVEMVWVPSGIFTMGSPENEPDRSVVETQHQVILTGFYMGKYQVTQEQYQAVMGNNPSHYAVANGHPPETGETDAKRPVEQVSWYDAIVFCNKLSILEGLDPVYEIAGSAYPAAWGNIPTSNNTTWNAVKIINGANGYRLPTEAEWEYACRAGTTTAYNTGATISNNTGWYNINSGSKTHQVGLKPPNAWGVYDMHGNVWDWCWDWYGNYASGTQADPKGASSGSNRVFRGGSLVHPAGFMRSAKRNAYGDGPYYRAHDIGFRLVRNPITVKTRPSPTTNVFSGSISGSLTYEAFPSVSGAAISYQWYSNTTNSNIGGTPIGVTSASYAIPTTLTSGAYYYFCEISITDWATPVRSNVAAVFVYNKSPKGIEMMWVPAGTFLMGSPTTEPNRQSNETQHEVTLTNGFYIGKYVITQEQYYAIMNYNPSSFNSSPASGETQSKRPVEMVTWYDAVEFCNKLSAAEGLTSAYTITGRTPASGYPITNATVAVNWNVNGYRLPTEAQWEYVAKGGQLSQGYIYSGSNNVDAVAWYLGKTGTPTGNRTHEVGLLEPNELGIHDMSGNVWEWCWDWYDVYPNEEQINPTGASSGTNRVGRGGSWFHVGQDLRSAFRSSYNPSSRSNFMGFRLVRPYVVISE